MNGARRPISYPPAFRRGIEAAARLCLINDAIAKQVTLSPHAREALRRAIADTATPDDIEMLEDALATAGAGEPAFGRTVPRARGDKFDAPHQTGLDIQAAARMACSNGIHDLGAAKERLAQRRADRLCRAAGWALCAASAAAVVLGIWSLLS